MPTAISVVLRAWREDGEPVGDSEYARYVPLDRDRYPVEGLGEADRTVVASVCDVDLDECMGEDRAERAAEEIERRMRRFARDLAAVPPEAVRDFRARGVDLDVYVSVTGQAPYELDLSFPPPFLAAIAGRDLPLVVGFED